MNYKKAFIMLVLGMSCAACETALQTTSRVPHSLAGNWIADPGACDAVAVQLQKALEVAKGKELHDAFRHSRRVAVATGDIREPRPDPYAWELTEQQEQYHALLQAVRPVRELMIEQRPDQIVFLPTQAARRNFEPGAASTLVTTFAHLKVTTGWQNDEFVVRSKDSKSGIQINESYRIQPNGALLLSVILSVKYMEAQQFTVVYHQR